MIDTDQTNSTSSFLTIPLEEIHKYLKYHKIPPILSDLEATYLLVWNNLLDHPNRVNPSDHLKDFLLAYELQETFDQRYSMSYLLISPERELVNLATSLGLSQVDRTRIIRILGYLNLLDHDLSIFEALPKDIWELILLRLDCDSLRLFGQISRSCHRLFDSKELTDLVKIKLRESTRLDLSRFTKGELDLLCQRMERKSQIAAGGDFSLVLCSNNQLYSFGNNRSGQLGLESKIKSGRMPRPLKMASLGQIAAISAGGSHSLLLNSQGQVFSFGSHQYGQLGLGPLIGNCISGPLMIKTSEIGKIIAVSAGEFHSLILNDQGQVFSFGNNNHGQLGQGDLIGRNVPTLINPFGIGWIIAISAGGTHSLILNDQGQVFGFGYNGYAQFGLGDKVDRLVPILIDSIGDIVAISAGGDHSLFLNDQGQVFSCGSNICGQLGLGWRAGFGGIIPMLPGLGAGLGGPMQTFNLPMLIDDPKIGTIVAISAGSSSSFILNSQGQIFGFGNGQSGRLGIGNSMFQYSPVLISGSGIGKVLDITTGQYHSLLLNDQGQIYSFGDNESGRLGLGDTKEKWVPMLIEKLG